MAKITEEMIRMDTQRSLNEVKAKLNELLVKAKSASAKDALNKIYADLESSARSASVRAIEVDRKIRAVLTEYETEFMREGNEGIDEGTAKIIGKIFDVRSALSAVTLPSDKKKAFKDYRGKYKSYTKKEAKKNFEEEFSLMTTQVESYDKQIKILGKLVKSYNLDSIVAKKNTELNDIDAKIDDLANKFEASKDERERERLESEYKMLLSQKDECDVTLARINNARKNIQTTNQLLEEYNNQQKIARIDDSDENEIKAIVDKLIVANKKEIKKSEAISSAAEDYNLSRNKYMDASANRSSANSLAALSERKRMSMVEDAQISGSASVKGPSLADRVASKDKK